MNKKAQLGDQTMLPVFLFLLAIIVVGIIVGINSFFGAKYEFRQIDSSLLNAQITNCFSNNELDISNPDKIQEICKLNIKVIQDEMLLIIKQNGKQILKLGRGDETSCGLSDKSENFPKCTNSSITINQEQIEIIAGSNQESKQKLATSTQIGGGFGGGGGGSDF